MDAGVIRHVWLAREKDGARFMVVDREGVLRWRPCLFGAMRFESENGVRDFALDRGLADVEPHKQTVH